MFLLETLFTQGRGLFVVLVGLDNRYFLAIAVEQLAVAKYIAIVEATDIPRAQDAVAGGDEYRLLVGVAGPQMVEQQVRD